MRTSTALAALLFTATASAQVQPHGGMLRFPDVSATQIVFVYADDLWLVPREGGVAAPLASPPGTEAFPRFSPDGKTIAFVGNYDGNRDLYTIPIAGGVPTRVTYHPGVETLSDWTPDGKLMFFTNGLAGRDRQVQLFTVPPQGGMPEKLPVPYGAFGAISPSGEWLAYTPHTADNRTWKRYRGGMATDIWLFHLKNHSARRVTDWEGTDSLPMWQKDKL
jgi:tricorn protease